MKNNIFPCLWFNATGNEAAGFYTDVFAGKIAYGMPGFYLNKKPMVYFAAYKNHIGFYATPTGHEEFKKELSVYKQGKGSVQFPIKDEIPYQLIRKIVKFRKNEFQKL